MTMLDRMRRHRGLKWSLGLVAVTMVIFFIPQDYLQPTTSVGAAPGEAIAEVDGRELKAGDFQQRYLLRMQNYRNQFGAGMNEQLLRQLGVDQQVLADDRRAGGADRSGARDRRQRRGLAQADLRDSAAAGERAFHRRGALGSFFSRRTRR